MISNLYKYSSSILIHDQQVTFKLCADRIIVSCGLHDMLEKPKNFLLPIQKKNVLKYKMILLI